MKIAIVFPARDLEPVASLLPLMPLAPTLLAALTPPEHEVSLVDMIYGDTVDFEADVDVVAITVRTPLALTAYRIADECLARGKTVILGGPHVFACPEEARGHASSVAVGEAEELWGTILDDIEKDDLKDFYLAGPRPRRSLPGSVHHVVERPSLANLPMMRRDLLPRERYLMDSVFTTRGCPNGCRFCPVTSLFGAHIRHRPIDEVVAEVSSLRKTYYNVDDSVFGHPQLEGRPEENQYYLDLYAELAKLRPRRSWGGAGGLAAVNYRDGRRILELAAESGLTSLAAGLESISGEGQRQSGAWRKLHYASADGFNIDTMRENIRVIQSLGIEILGFFIVGWDEDTPETYQRTLDFCDECNLIPFIFTLIPMPGSRIHREYLEQGRMRTDLSWDRYGGEAVVFRHPTMSPEQMVELNARVMRDGYSMGRILSRTFRTVRNRPSLDVAKTSFFTQLGLRRGYRRLHEQGRR